MTIWGDIPGYEGLYRVATDGQVLSLGREIVSERRGTVCKIHYKPKLLEPQFHRHRARVMLYGLDGGKPTKHYIYDLVRVTLGPVFANALPDAFRKDRRHIGALA